MIWNTALLVFVLVLVPLGACAGFARGAVLTALLLAALGLLAASGVPAAPGPATGAALGWLALLILVGMIRRPRGRLSQLGGGALGLVQAVAVAVVGAGLIGAAGPGPGVERANAWPAIAGIGGLIEAALPVDGLTNPQPVMPAPDEALRPVAWAEAEAADATRTRLLVGRVQARNRAPLSFEVTGVVRDVAVEIGDAFAAGDVLATLDPTTFRIAVTEAEAALAEAGAALTEARQDHARQTALHRRGVVSEAARDGAEARLAAAEARHRAAEAAVATAGERLADTRLVAPYPGRVADRLVEPAAQVAAGQAVFEVQGAEGGFEVAVTVPETLIGGLERGSEHGVRLLDGRDTARSATLAEIGPRAGAASGFPVTLSFAADAAGLRAGMTAEVALRLPTDRPEGAVAVPLTAVAPGADETMHVFVFDAATGTLARRPVALSGTEGDRALIADGLAPGEIVATAGLPFLEDGMAVALLGTGVARYDQ